MQKTCSTYQSYLSKVLLGFICLWSVFLFSGYVENDALTLQETVSTELTDKKAKTSPVVSYQKVQAFRYFLTIQNHFSYKLESALNNYNNLIETTFLQLQKKGYNYLIWKPFLFARIFPISTKLDVPSFLIV